MKEDRQILLFRWVQWHEELSDRGKTAFKKCFAELIAFVREVKSDRPLVAPSASFDQSIGDKPINKAHRAGVRQAKHTAQLMV